MNTEEQAQLAARQLVATVLASLAQDEVRKARKALEDSIRPGGKVVAVLPDGTELGDVQRTKRPETVDVTDHAALLAFVERTRPDEVVTTKAIRPAYMTWLLEWAHLQLTAPGADGLVVDKDGEVIPGLALSYGTSAYRPTPSKQGRHFIQARLGELLGAELAQLLTLPSPDDS